jgi:hypothetical protein
MPPKGLVSMGYPIGKDWGQQMSDASFNSGVVFCVACANKLVPTAAFCPKCGTPRAHVPIQGVNAGDGKKSKTTAVLLAVFLSYWTWLYSYKKDAAKFYVGLGLSFILVLGNILFLASIWSLIIYWVRAGDPGFAAMMISQQAELVAFFWATYFVSVVIWILAIISAAMKPSRF